MKTCDYCSLSAVHRIHTVREGENAPRSDEDVVDYACDRHLFYAVSSAMDRRRRYTATSSTFTMILPHGAGAVQTGLS